MPPGWKDRIIRLISRPTSHPNSQNHKFSVSFLEKIEIIKIKSTLNKDKIIFKSNSNQNKTKRND